jgi:hypothetical protein
LLNHTYSESIKGFPIQRLTGDTPDISVLLRFNFWNKVYYKQINALFPSDSVEQVGHIVGISDHCGNALTYRGLNPFTLKVIHRSLIRPATAIDPNLRADSLGGKIDDDIAPVLKSRHNFIDEDTKLHTMNDNHPPSSIIDIEDIIGRSFILDDKDRVKVLISLNNDTCEEVIRYNQLLGYLAKDSETETLWKFKQNTSHQGTLLSSHPDYNGSSYNLMIGYF